jgi:hypothetical protein
LVQSDFLTGGATAAAVVAVVKPSFATAVVVVAADGTVEGDAVFVSGVADEEGAVTASGPLAVEGCVAADAAVEAEMGAAAVVDAGSADAGAAAASTFFCSCSTSSFTSRITFSTGVSGLMGGAGGAMMGLGMVDDVDSGARSFKKVDEEKGVDCRREGKAAVRPLKVDGENVDEGDGDDGKMTLLRDCDDGVEHD